MSLVRVLTLRDRRLSRTGARQRGILFHTRNRQAGAVGLSRAGKAFGNSPKLHQCPSTVA